MMHVQAQNIQLENTSVSKAASIPTGQELETVVAGLVVADLNQQLADISEEMKRQLEEKQGIRSEIESIYKLKTNPSLQNIDGVPYVDLNAEQAQLLGVTEIATPLTTENGEVTLYRLHEDDFQATAKNALELREGSLEELNSNGELTMLKIQSLVDQRKNALTLLSNLLAAGNEIAKTIIGNIRG